MRVGVDEAHAGIEPPETGKPALSRRLPAHTLTIGYRCGRHIAARGAPASTGPAPVTAPTSRLFAGARPFSMVIVEARGLYVRRPELASS